MASRSGTAVYAMGARWSGPAGARRTGLASYPRSLLSVCYFTISKVVRALQKSSIRIQEGQPSLEALKTLQNLIVLQRFSLREQNLKKRTNDRQRVTLGA